MINKIKLLDKIRKQPDLTDLDELNIKKNIVESWFKELRDKICNDFLILEKSIITKSNYSENREKMELPSFVKKKWKRGNDGGGGVMSIMKGKLFEKVGVNISTVYGKFSDDLKKEIPGAEKTGTFWATGISVVAHMYNPKVPAAHMNTRLFVTGEGNKQKYWFGGGCDLTPMLPDDDAKKIFHKYLRLMCNKYDKEYYENFKKWCDNYFYLPHRDEHRGVGGIFFDYFNNLDWEQDLEFIKSVGLTFLEAFNDIVEKRKFREFSNQDKFDQLVKRGRYVEFNLLYDRGTIFGLKTGGNIDAILMSLPPDVKWN